VCCAACLLICRLIHFCFFIVFAGKCHGKNSSLSHVDCVIPINSISLLGVSGSCSMKTCWRKLSDFNNTAAALRIKYHQAIRKLSYAKAARRAANRERRERLVTVGTFGSGRMMGGGDSLDDPNFEQLYYLEQSPTFCAFSKGRQCLSPDNCSILCCGRGYTTRVIKQVEKCKCRFQNGRCCNVICDRCEKYEDRYYCK